MSLERKQFFLGNTSLDLLIYTDKELNPWFKAKEVAVFLGYKDTNDAIRKHVFNSNKLSWNDTPAIHRGLASSANWQANTIFINEAGLYQLMFRSKLANMEAFQHWVTSDVLPSIRKAGQYKIPDAGITWDQYRSDMRSKDEMMERRERCAAQERSNMMSTIKKMMPYVVKRPANSEQNHVLHVYHQQLSQYLHSYTGIRCQKRYLKQLTPKNKQLIYAGNSPNAMSAYNRLKDHIGKFRCRGNVITCNILPDEIIKKLHLY